MSNQYSNREGFPQPSRDAIKRIITDPSAAEELIRVAEEVGRWLAKPLSTSQIRAIYGEVLRIKGDWLDNPDEGGKERREAAKRALVLLRPKMAYRARKERGDAVRNLVSVLDPAVELVRGDDGNFKRFVEFFEAILAYHKAAGGN